ncbi:hypothetical protein ACGF5O_32190 [Streptomyces sp. NPDC048291]|uniref:hypothetical protein n=1 Tax=Streptomyces sp. NPDC048291 TaxID=3365530 RepID=UPI00371A27F1
MANEGTEEKPSGRPRRARIGAAPTGNARYADRHGWIQLDHGERRNPARLGRGKGFVSYPPTERLGERTKLRFGLAPPAVEDFELLRDAMAG